MLFCVKNKMAGSCVVS